jgi:hypothetical protein
MRREAQGSGAIGAEAFIRGPSRLQGATRRLAANLAKRPQLAEKPRLQPAVDQGEEAAMPDPSADRPQAERPQAERPKSRETEYEDVKPKTPPCSANEPRGSEASVKTSRTATDPSSGEARNRPDPKATTPPGRKGP